MSNQIKRIIELAIELGVIGTNFKNPIRFKSGIMSPIYCDWRKCSKSPELMKLISETFYQKIRSDGAQVIMGVAAGAVPHSERLASAMGLPSSYVRPGAKAKDYGLGKLIEGANVEGMIIFMVEDLFSTGGSALENYRIVKKAGAKEVRLCSIFSYDMQDLHKEFAKEGITPESLITIHDVMPYLKDQLPREEYSMLEDWVKDPREWFSRHKTKFEFGFLTQLRSTAQAYGIVSFGLDPVIESLPKEYSKLGIPGFVSFTNDLISEMVTRGVMPGMLKPNEGFYTKYNRNVGSNSPGTLALNDLIFNIASMAPNLPVIIDAKRGDIGKSSDNYSEQYLSGSHQPFDAITVHPYMGSDSVLPFAKYCNNRDAKGVYVLNKTSNPGSNDFQMLKMQDGRYMYEHVSDKIVEWAKGRPGVGAVVGGTDTKELQKILKFFAGKDIPVLVPGVGSQGGSAKEVAEIAREVGFELHLLRINSSSGLSHPWYKKSGDLIPEKNECIDMCINELKKMNDEVGYNISATA